MKFKVIVGGAVLDITASVHTQEHGIKKSSFPGEIAFNVGGVGRNVAEAAFRLDSNPLFVSVVGNDSAGEMIMNYHRNLNMVK
jgi:sugar/nucleoside kinase (ribokinase family)